MPTIRYGSSYGTIPDATRAMGTDQLASFAPLTGYTILCEDNNLGTGGVVNGPTGSAKQLLYRITDTNIPTQSTGGSVVIWVVADMWLASGNSLYYAKYKTYLTSLESVGISNDPAVKNSATIYTDAEGSALTGSNFQTSYWGVNCAQIPSGAAVYCYEIQVAFTFTLPDPTPLTAAPSVVTASTATILGTINPNSATAAYPVSYRFAWGTDPGALTNTIDGLSTLTGSAPIDVSTNIESLSAGTTYYYELQAWTPEGSVQHGGIMSLVTIGATTQISKIASF
jgi:hypothetical protein